MTHILEKVLTLDDTSPIWKAIHEHNYSDIRDFVSISPAELDLLSYTKTDGTTAVLAGGQRGALRSFILMIEYNKQQGTQITDWMAVTEDHYDDFRTGPHISTMQGGPHPPPPSASTTPSGTGPRGPSTRDPVAEFRKGIKRDISQFSSLKDEKQWDTWNRSTLAQARAQDVSDILDPTYLAGTRPEKELFHEKQKYMFAVLEKTLLTDQGKACVRKYASTFDAQSVYKDISEYAINSTKASISSSTILSYITSIRLGSGTWKGSTHSFILHWQNQVRLYETQVPTSDHFSPGQKLHMLQNSVEPIQELRTVRTQTAQHKTQTGNDITYDQYVELLLSASSTYDAQFTPQQQRSRNHRPPAHAVYNHGVTYGNADAYYDIDSPVDVIQVNAHQRPITPRVPGSSMSKDQWTRLSKDAQTTWDTMSSESKAIILEAGRRPFARRPARTLNLHEVTAYDYINANLHDICLAYQDYDLSQVPPADDIPHEEAPPTEQPPRSANTTFLLNTATRTSSVPPSDINRILSQTPTRTDSTGTDNAMRLIAASRTSTTPSQRNPASNDSITINGKQFRQVNINKVIYSVSAHRTAQNQSLVDHGANGGVAGEDVRVFQYTEQLVDVQGIDNHQIVNIPIVSCGGVVTTQRGPVIALFNQYAYTGKGRTIHSSGQLEWFKNDVNDRSLKVDGGLQRIITNDGYVLPISIKDGLPYTPSVHTPTWNGTPYPWWS